MGKHYGYTIRDVEQLTFAQLTGYIRNLRYVIETSSDFGRPPAIAPPMNELTAFADRCGIEVPYDVQLQLLKRE